MSPLGMSSLYEFYAQFELKSPVWMIRTLNSINGCYIGEKCSVAREKGKE
jgi:hypothetical protein